MIRILRAWGPAIAWATALFYASSRSWDDVPVPIRVNDKLVHLALYGVLGAALAFGRRRSEWRPAHFLLLLLGVLYALSDEFHQSFVPGRTSSAADLAADAVGLLLGYLGCHILTRRTRGDA